MPSDRDTYRTAFDYLEQHSNTAPIFAAMEADRLLNAGDLDGATTWCLIVRAIKRKMKPEGMRY